MYPNNYSITIIVDEQGDASPWANKILRVDGQKNAALVKTDSLE
jgi:hypothetical protein